MTDRVDREGSIPTVRTNNIRNCGKYGILLARLEAGLRAFRARAQNGPFIDSSC